MKTRTNVFASVQAMPIAMTANTATASRLALIARVRLAKTRARMMACSAMEPKVAMRSWTRAVIPATRVMGFVVSKLRVRAYSSQIVRVRPMVTASMTEYFATARKLAARMESVTPRVILVRGRVRSAVSAMRIRVSACRSLLANLTPIAKTTVYSAPELSTATTMAAVDRAGTRVKLRTMATRVLGEVPKFAMKTSINAIRGQSRIFGESNSRWPVITLVVAVAPTISSQVWSLTRKQERYYRHFNHVTVQMVARATIDSVSIYSTLPRRLHLK